MEKDDGRTVPLASEMYSDLKSANKADGKNTQSITLAVPLNAVSSAGNLAKITFVIDAAFTMSNAYGWIQAVV